MLISCVVFGCCLWVWVGLVGVVCGFVLGVLRCGCVLFVEWFCWFVIVCCLVWFWFALLFVFGFGVCFCFIGDCLVWLFIVSVSYHVSVCTPSYYYVLCGLGVGLGLLVVGCFLVGILLLVIWYCLDLVLCRLLFDVLFLMYMSPITMCLFGVILGLLLFVCLLV